MARKNMHAIERQVVAVLAKDPDALFFLNLTNGLDAIDKLERAGVGRDVMRFSMIQSTHLEQKNMDQVICQLGPEMLMALACGRTCAVIDFGAGKELSRAVYQGVPFVRYCLERAWFGKQPDEVLIYPRSSSACGQNAAESFDRWYRGLSRSSKAFIKRFRKYACHPTMLAVNGGQVKLVGISAATGNDGDYAHYVDLAANRLVRKRDVG